MLLATYIFGFIAAALAVLAGGVSFTKDQGDKYPILKKLDGKQIYLLFGFLFFLLLATTTGFLGDKPSSNLELGEIEQDEILPSRPPDKRVGKPPGDVEAFSVYPNYDPSGYMGDIGDITVEKGPEVIRFTYETRGWGPHEWEYKYVNGQLYAIPCQFAGVMFLNPPNNWGEDPNGGFDLRSVRQVIKWEARSLTGPVNVEFVIGGVIWRWDDEKRERVGVPYPDSMPRFSLGIKTLTEDWQPFEVDLSGIPEDNFRSVVGGFAWVISWGSNRVRLNAARMGPEQPKTFTFELRNIHFER